MSWFSTGAVDDFLAEAGEFLRAERVRNTVILTVTESLRVSEQTPADEPPADEPPADEPPARDAPLFGYWRPASSQRAPGQPESGQPESGQPESGRSRVGGAFMLTPGFPALLTHMSPKLAADLAGHLAASGRPLQGVNAEEEAAWTFADAWRRHTGDVAEIHRRMRLFRLAELAAPQPAPKGTSRQATARDRGFLIDWLGAFAIEAGDLATQDQGAAADERLSYGGITLWEEDGVPVSVAGVTRIVAGMVRVGPVYTPPAQRGHGYAAGATVAVSQAALDAGATDVLLYTDLANPTSNALYQRLGYRPVEDRLVLSFGPAETS
jgi:RimJ/RimL family protein N-acetyltransferase